MGRHAYMIMAHHRPDLLQRLIDALDDVRNDIIVHIDKKSAMNPGQFHCSHAKLFFSERMSVNWGGYTQIACEYSLMRKAAEIGEHSYYHFLTGVNYPLWNQDVIHSFFNEHQGYEFIGFDHGRDYSFRARYHILFSEYGKLRGVKGRGLRFLRKIAVEAQKLLGMDRLKRLNIEIKKGCAYFSVTEDFLQELLQQEPMVEKLFSHTICCDEVFVQTIAYNSTYRSRLYNVDHEWEGCMREFAWPSNVSGPHPGHNFSMSDLEHLLNSKRMFAMKFESVDGVCVIDKIKELREIR